MATLDLDFKIEQYPISFVWHTHLSSQLSEGSDRNIAEFKNNVSYNSETYLKTPKITKIK